MNVLRPAFFVVLLAGVFLGGGLTINAIVNQVHGPTAGLLVAAVVVAAAVISGALLGAAVKPRRTGRRRQL